MAIFTTREHEVVARGLCNVEGPTAGPADWLLNVCSVSRPVEPWPTVGGDIVATRIGHPEASQVLLNTSTDAVVGIPAALAFGPDSALYICDEGRRSIVRVAADGQIDDWVTAFNGARINGPNDLSFGDDGYLYFTDPWTSSPRNPIGAVYGCDPATRQLTRIDSGMQFPNGIVASGGLLYVAETYPSVVWAYELDGSGGASHKRLFCRLPEVDDPPLLPRNLRDALGVDSVTGPDGMCLDVDGNLYVAHYGGGAVVVYSPDGSLIEQLEVPGAMATNVCFGGDGHSTLFVSVDDPGLIAAYPTTAVGRAVPHCPSGRNDHPFLQLLGDQARALPGRRNLTHSGS